MRSSTKILLIYTGGTIGMQKDFETGALKAFNFDKLLKQVPELKLLDCTVETISFDDPIDSSNIRPESWVAIAEVIEENYTAFDGFVVLHGSDTMSYSASALSFMLENLAKPVIFTGSQLPIGDLRTDAKENLITAIQIASLQENGRAVIAEVGLYFEYKLFRGNRTTKISAEHFNAFTSPNYPCLIESGVHLMINNDLLLPFSKNKELQVHKVFDTNVMIVKMFPGINKKVLQTLMTIPDLKGIVIETFGSGNALTEAWFIELLEKSILSGIPIINVTQCAEGSVDMGIYETSSELKRIGVISGKDCTTEAAITKLMHLLGRKIPTAEFKNEFEKSIRGEMG
ncbi:MAG: asparaginase [Flavobacterium sp.]